MKFLFLLLFLTGCTGDNISRCSYACERSKRPMDHYSDKDGCVCEKEGNSYIESLVERTLK